MTISWRSALLMSALAQPAALLSHAAAQQVPADSTQAVELQPVVVNVLRTPFDLNAAPFAVAVNGEAEIQRAQPGLGLDEALRGLPGVQVDDRYNFALGDRISIRGIGARTQFGVRGVTVLVDGIPATLPDGQTNLNHVDLSFLRRAEVIRGPASSLYGNAAGGVIQFESELPPPVPFSQQVGIVAGQDGLVRLNSTSGGRSGSAHYLLNVTRLTFDGYRRHQDAENLQINGSLAYLHPGSELRFVGSYVDYDANNPGSLSAVGLAQNRDSAHIGNVNGRTGERGNQGQVGAFWRRALGGGELELAGYGITREIDNPIPGVIIDIERMAGGVRGMYRGAALASLMNLQWSLGAEADVQDDVRLNFVNTSGARGALTTDQDEQVLDGSVFAQLTAQPAPRLTAMAGVRFDATRFKVSDNLVGEANPNDSGERTMEAVSPSFGLNYSFADALSVYGNVGTSFETPTTTELANQEGRSGGFNLELEPQHTVSFEGGAKGLIAGSVSYQLALYRMNIDDSLIPFQVGDGSDRSYYRNAGSSVHQGVEAGLTVSPFPGVSANLAYTYTDAEFDEYVVGGNDYSGNQVPGVSPHRLDGSLSYSAPLGVFATVDARYADELQVNDANSATSPSYTVVDVRAGMQRLRLGGVVLEPFVGVTNLFDEEYNTSVTVNAFPLPPNPNGRYFEPGPGRSVYGGAQVRFDVR